MYVLFGRGGSVYIAGGGQRKEIYWQKGYKKKIKSITIFTNGQM
jgi:hypothetical protein